MNPDENEVTRAGGGAPQKIKRSTRRRSPILQPKVLIPMVAGLLGLLGMIVLGVVLSEDDAGGSMTAIAELPAPEKVLDPRYVQPSAEQESSTANDAKETPEGSILSLTADGESRLESIATAENRVAEDPMVETGKMTAGARSVLQAYQDAKTPEDLIPLVRNPEATAPLIREFYSRPGRSLEKLALTDGSLGMKPYKYDGRDYIVSQLRWEDFSRCIVVLDWDGSRYRLDWQALVEYDTFPWERFIKQRPNTQQRFRVLAAPDDFFVGSFEDAEEFHCLRLTKGREESALYAYFRKGDPKFEQLEILLRETLSFPVAFIVDLSFTANGVRNQVVIENFVKAGWITDF